MMEGAWLKPCMIAFWKASYSFPPDSIALRVDSVCPAAVVDAMCIIWDAIACNALMSCGYIGI